MPSARPHLICATATPLDRDLHCHRPLLLRHCRELLEWGCDAIALFGTTGEGPTLPTAERRAVLEHLLERGIAPGRLIAACGSASTLDAIELARHALSVGVERVLVMPPFFLRQAATDDGVLRFYGELIERVADDRLRLLLYHFPDISGVSLPVDLVGRLRTSFGEVVSGIKDSGGDWQQTAAYLDAFADMAVYTGTEVHARRARSRGGAGTICGLANVAPGLLRQLLDEPDDERAAQLTRALQHVDDLLVARGFLRSCKAAIAALSGDDAWRRVMPPLAPLGDDDCATIARELPQLIDAGPGSTRSG
jgi:4-hydroxy-tetrahydrodipicolinate synthase